MQEGQMPVINIGASAEARYRALFESAGDAILIVNDRGSASMRTRRRPSSSGTSDKSSCR